MKRHFFFVTALAVALLSIAAPARAQIEPEKVVVVDPTTGQGLFPFGSVTVGVSSSGVRVGPFGCYVNTSDPTYTNSQVHPCSLTTDGRIRVDPGGIHAEDTLHTSGHKGFMALGVRVADCNSALAGTVNFYNPLQFDSSGRLCTALGNGSATVTENGTVTLGQANVALVVPIPYFYDGANMVRDTGASKFRSIDLDETEEEVKATGGQIFSIWFTNTATATRWLKCYDATDASVTVGTTTPYITIGLPGNSSDDITGQLSTGAHGGTFANAITCAATTGVADNDTGAPGANEVIVNIWFK
jgi:hypothetical protein